MPLNRSDVIDGIAGRAGLTNAQADAALAAFEDVLIAAVSAGQAVKLLGLFSLERVERAARAGRNPRTGAAITIPARFGVKLSAGRALKVAARL